MSHQATFLDRYREAVNLARAAQMGSKPHATARQQAQLHAMEARAHARLGDAAFCDAALSDATSALERAGGDEPAWIGYFDDRELYAEIGHCYRDLGRARQAASYVEQSVDGTCGPRSDFFAAMVGADAHLAAHDYDRATADAFHALQLGEQLDSQRCLAYLSEFHQRLPTGDPSPVVRDFLDQAAAAPLWQRAITG